MDTHFLSPAAFARMAGELRRAAAAVRTASGTADDPDLLGRLECWASAIDADLRLARQPQGDAVAGWVGPAKA